MASVYCPYEPAHAPVVLPGRKRLLPSCGHPECIYPVHVCGECGGWNRALARHCRDCSLDLDVDEAPESGAGLRRLWNAAIEDRVVEITHIPLPEGVGSVTALASRWGLLLVGTSRGYVIGYNAVIVGTPLFSFSCGSQIISFGFATVDGGALAPAPGAWVTARTGVFMLRLLPQPALEPLWKSEGEMLVGPVVPGPAGFLAFTAGERVRALLVSIGGGPLRMVADSLDVPLGGPVPLDAGRALFFTAAAFFVFDPGAEGATRTDSFLELDPVLSGAVDPHSATVFLSYAEDGRRGLAAIAPPYGAITRLLDADLIAPRATVLSPDHLCVATRNDLSLHMLPSGRPYWSLRRDQQIDELATNRFAPARHGDFLLMYAEGQGAARSIEVLDTGEGLAHGIQRLALVPGLDGPPVVLPAGIVSTASVGHDQSELVLLVPPAE